MGPADVGEIDLFSLWSPSFVAFLEARFCPTLQVSIRLGGFPVTDISAAMFARKKSGHGDKFAAFSSTGRLACSGRRSDQIGTWTMMGNAKRIQKVEVSILFTEPCRCLGFLKSWAGLRKITSCESLNGLIHLQSGFPEGLQLREPRTRPIKPAVEPWLQRF